MYKDAFERICELLPHQTAVEHSKRGQIYLLQFTVNSKVVFSYPYKTLEEADYACLIAHLLRLALAR